MDMQKDGYDNDITTSSGSARDLYVQAVNTLLSAGPGLIEAFRAVTKADPHFALGHAGLARALVIYADPKAARIAMAAAQAVSDGVTEREASHLHALGLLIDGKGPQAVSAIRAHVATYPRDAVLAQTCTSVFGLIGFSGQPGRESELLAYTASLLPHYGDDWWMMSQHAVSLCETGQTAKAVALMERSLAINPRNANGAHFRAHAYYENGEADAGIQYLADWLTDYDRSAILHGHLSWHVALWSLGQGDTARMWQIVDDAVGPGATTGLPINVLTDTASILYRAELAGETVSADRWTQISNYAAACFPNPGLGFVDVHAALAHAMAGQTDALERIIANPVGPTADLVRAFGEAYQAIARQDWETAKTGLIAALPDNARIGGSRAQRDLLEHTLLGVLLKLGRADEARDLLALRRPVQAHSAPVMGM